MKIAISQRDTRFSPMPFEFDALERVWYRYLTGHTLIPIPNLVHDFDYDSLDYDCLIITGGPDSLDRNMTENILFAYAYKQNKPIIGICHGAFAVNDLTGGKNGRVEGHWETEHKIIMSGEEYTVNSYHGQSILSIGKNMEILAVDESNNIEAFKHKQYPIYGVVWHPERMEVPILPKQIQDILF
jgi:gamma-glutamyl-gamma-aminobutyrate hydrolase PuuD